MYSSLQQQCLVELGVTPYDLNDNYQQGNSAQNSSETLQKETFQTQDIAPASLKPELLKPNVTAGISSLLTSNSNVQAKAQKTVKPLQETKEVVAPVSPPVVSQAIDHWAECSTNFIADLNVIFPNINLAVNAFDSIVAQLSEHAFWKIAPKTQAQYVQLESVENATVLTSPLPSELTVSQKKELWLLLQPYIIQPSGLTESQN